MSPRLAAVRIFLAAAAITALAACASPTAPTTSHLRNASSLNHDIADTTCKSGYSIGQGFHC